MSLRLALDAREVPLQFFWVVAQPVLLGLVAQPVLLGLVAQPVLLGLVAQPVTRGGRPCSPIISVGLTARGGMPHFTVRASLPSPSPAPPRKGRGARGPPPPPAPAGQKKKSPAPHLPYLTPILPPTYHPPKWKQHYLTACHRELGKLLPFGLRLDSACVGGWWWWWWWWW